MSTKKGNAARTRPQKYQNRFAFKNDLHDTSNKIKLINSMQIAEVCPRCKEQIDWKRKYRKYKPLTQPRTCNKCGEKAVRAAYHVICTACVLKHRQCAKCLVVESEQVTIIPPAKTKEEEQREKQEIEDLLKTLPERKRRTFLRYVRRKEKAKKEEKEAPNKPDVPDDFMKKFEELQMKNADDDFGYLYDLDTDEEGECSDFESDGDDSDVRSESESE